MRGIECPVCHYGFIKRTPGKRCPGCRTILVHEGERFFRQPGHRVFLWNPERREWSEVD